MSVLGFATRRKTASNPKLEPAGHPAAFRTTSNQWAAPGSRTKDTKTGRVG